MSLGLALTVIVTAVPFFGSPVGELIFRHVEAGYPSYSVSAATTATMIYLVGLTVVGLIGMACWIVSLAATRAGKRWAPEIATVALVLAVSVGLFDLMVRDTSGDTGLPSLIGWLGLLPCLPGAFAVVVLWMEPPVRKSAVGSASY
jgi:hypothetical protein